MSGCNQENFDDDFLRGYLSDTLETLIMIGCNQETITNHGFLKFRKLKFLNITDCHQEGIKSNFISKLFKNNKELKAVQIYKNMKFLREKCTPQYFRKIKRKRINGKIFYSEGSELISRFVWVIPDEEEFMKNLIFRCKGCKEDVKPWICEECDEEKEIKCPFCDERNWCGLCSSSDICSDCMSSCSNSMCYEDNSNGCVTCIKRYFVKCSSSRCGRYFCGEGCGRFYDAGHGVCYGCF